jgi:hypothetical protein
MYDAFCYGEMYKEYSVEERKLLPAEDFSYLPDIV